MNAQQFEEAWFRIDGWLAASLLTCVRNRRLACKLRRIRNRAMTQLIFSMHSIDKSTFVAIAAYAERRVKCPTLN